LDRLVMPETLALRVCRVMLGLMDRLAFKALLVMSVVRGLRVMRVRQGQREMLAVRVCKARWGRLEVLGHKVFRVWREARA